MRRTILHHSRGACLYSAVDIDAQYGHAGGSGYGVPPHKIIGNIYYVGTRTLSSFLIVTPRGNILIDSTYERNVPTIKKSVEQLGFKFSDIKILLGNHAHGDHQEGDAMVSVTDFSTRLRNSGDFCVCDASQFQALQSTGDHGFDADCVSGGDLQYGLEARVVITPVDVSGRVSAHASRQKWRRQKRPVRTRLVQMRTAFSMKEL